jgi:glycosyltransferase involved in cell wall biosynthesis
MVRASEKSMSANEDSVVERSNAISEPRVSVITPFHNAAPYLPQCIESVLAQSFTQFEYLLVDNCSTDGSSEIADKYARLDSRIRFIRRSQFASQVENFNSAIAQISEASQYFKIVCADDFIFPDCLKLMVQAFELSESIGLVSSYCLMGNVILGSGYPYPTPLLSGRELGRRYFLGQVPFVFGSTTTVMYRSSLVRRQSPFFRKTALHFDTEKCLEILAHSDFGFVHQVLSFLRTDNESISSSSRGFDPEILDLYINVRRYSTVFLEVSEAAALSKKVRKLYYRTLAKAAIRFREGAFWRYHDTGLKLTGERLDRSHLALQIGLELFAKAFNPQRAVLRLLSLRKPRPKDRWQPDPANSCWRSPNVRHAAKKIQCK